MSILLQNLISPQGIKVYGSTASARAGLLLNAVGDVNNDGIDDFIIIEQGTGTAYLIFGKTTSWADIDLASFSVLDGIKITDNSTCMITVSKAKDVNGDGIDDFLLGVPCLNTAYLIFGKAIWLDIDLINLLSSDGMTFTTNNQLDRVGISVVGGQDIDGDNIPDILIGASGTNDDKGVVYVVFGSSISSWTNTDLAAMTSTQGVTMYCMYQNYIGSFINFVGDINNDNINDFAIGVPASTLRKGVVNIMFGKSNWQDIDLFNLQPQDGIRIYGSGTHDLLGRAVSGIDVNNDGYSDLILAAPAHNTVYVVFGKNGVWADINLDTLDAAAGIKISGTTAYIVEGIKDINGDAINDILIGDPENNISYIIFGSATLTDIDVTVMSSTDGIAIYGSNTNDWSGCYVCDAGDINNDGQNDILIGASEVTYQTRENSGTSYLIFDITS